MSKNVLLISPEMIKERTAIHTNIDDKLLFPTIKVCQDMFIHPLLGTTLYNKIVTEVEAGSITGDYKTLLDDYIIDSLCWYVLSKAIFDVTYQMWNKGVVKKQGDSTDLLGTDELEALRNEYKNRAEYYGERLTTYLQAYSTTDFIPEYLITTGRCDDVTPQTMAYDIPVYLGDIEDCHCKTKFVP